MSSVAIVLSHLLKMEMIVAQFKYTREIDSKRFDETRFPH